MKDENAFAEIPFLHITSNSPSPNLGEGILL